MLHVHRQIVSLQRWEPRVVCQKRENADRFPMRGGEECVTVLPRMPWKNARRWWYRSVKRSPLEIPAQRVAELLAAVQQTKADAVHVFFGHIGVLLRPFLRVCPVPVVVSFHGADTGVDAGDAAWREALAEVFRSATLVQARSESLLSGLRALGCPAEKLRLQRTGVPLDQWPHICRSVPQDGAWHFLQACRLVPKKGLRTTLAAFQEIVREFPAARLTLAGDGPLREELQTAVKAAGLQDRVDFPGFLNQTALRPLVESAHFFFHPSETPADGNQEGVPNALLEAMASGLPALATTHGGIPEAVTHGVDGLLMPERDAAGLAAAALGLMHDPAAWQRMSAAASASVAEKFERGRQTEILEACYDEAIRLARPLPARPG